MRKKLAYVFIGVILVLTIVYLIRYKQALMLENKVPNAATQVVHVDVRQIEHHILMDAVRYPLKYIDFRLPEKKKDSLRLRKTISLPQNFLLYSNETTFKDGWFSSFVRVKKKTKLSLYLEREGFNKNVFDDIVLFEKNNFILAVKDERLLVVYRKVRQAEIITTVKAIFEEVNFLSEDSDLLKPISNSKSDISYTTLTNDFIEADFRNGLFEVFGTLNSDVFVVSNHKEFSKNSIGHLTAKLNKDHPFFSALITEKNSQKFTELTKLSIDSIASKWNGNVAFNLNAIRTKIDTIVTYDYDDDFNKIEKKSIQALTIPDAVIRLGADANLFEYLLYNKSIQVVESDTLFTSVPLYKMYATTSSKTLDVSTTKDIEEQPVNENIYKLDAYFDIERYVQNPLEFSLLPSSHTYVELLKNTELQLSKNNTLSFKVRLKNNDRNFMGQLIKP